MPHKHGLLTLRREDGRIVCEHVKVADTWRRRLRGLLFRRSVESDFGVVLRPSSSIHTAFMQFPIDVVFLDRDLRVLKIAASVPPFRAVSCRGSREIVELKAGECERRGLAVGDRVAWASRDLGEAGLSSENVLVRPAHAGDVVVASDDQRFVRLARFMLDGHGLNVSAQVRPDRLATAVEDGESDGVLLDARENLADALRLVHTVRVGNPTLPVVIVGEGAASRTPTSITVYDKWDQLEAAIDALAIGIESSAS